MGRLAGAATEQRFADVRKTAYSDGVFCRLRRFYGRAEPRSALTFGINHSSIKC